MLNTFSLSETNRNYKRLRPDFSAVDEALHHATTHPNPNVRARFRAALLDLMRLSAWDAAAEARGRDATRD